MFIAAFFGAGPVWAQKQDEARVVQSPILTIDSDRLYRESAFGKRVEAEFQANVAVVEAENRQIEADLTAEELDLTEQRADLTPDAFRGLADAFDEKVQTIREAQRNKLLSLTQSTEEARRQFLDLVAPVLQQIMAEARAALIVETRSVFMSANAIDVTQLAIFRIDTAIGDGRKLLQPEQDDSLTPVIGDQ